MARKGQKLKFNLVERRLYQNYLYESFGTLLIPTFSCSHAHLLRRERGKMDPIVDLGVYIRRILCRPGCPCFHLDDQPSPAISELIDKRASLPSPEGIGSWTFEHFGSTNDPSDPKAPILQVRRARASHIIASICRILVAIPGAELVGPGDGCCHW